MSERTPGPWHWEDAYDFEPYKGNRDWQSENFKQGRIKLVAADGSTVLEEWASYADDGGLSVKRGDALVIGAAWDLLESLKAICERLEQIQFDHNTSDGDLVLSEARAAIAKAEGKV